MRRLKGALLIALGACAGAALSSAIMYGAEVMPRVRVTAPSDGSRVSGVVTLVAAADGRGISSLQFQTSGQMIGPEIRSGACTATWDTRVLSNGHYPILAVARDAGGRYQRTDPVFVTVINDGTPRARPR